MTPSTVTLKSGAGYFSGEKYTFNFSKDGYADKTATLDTELNGWYFGNIVFGGFLGMLIIDPASGAMWSLPDSFTADMGAARPDATSSKNNPKLGNVAKQELKGYVAPKPSEED